MLYSLLMCDPQPSALLVHHHLQLSTLSLELFGEEAVVLQTPGIGRNVVLWLYPPYLPVRRDC